MACRGLMFLLSFALAAAETDSTTVPSKAQVAEWNFDLAMQEFKQAFNRSQHATKQVSDRAAALKGKGSQLAKKIIDEEEAKLKEQMQKAESALQENLKDLQHSIAAEEAKAEAVGEKLKADRADQKAAKTSKQLEKATERARYAEEVARNMSARARNMSDSAKSTMKEAIKDQEAEVDKLLHNEWKREVAETEKDASKQAHVEKAVEDKMRELEQKKANATQKLKEDQKTISENQTSKQPVFLSAFPSQAQRQDAQDLAVKKSVDYLAHRLKDQAKDLKKLEQEQVRSLHRSLEDTERQWKAEAEKLDEAAKKSAEDARKKASFILSVGAAAGKNMTLLRSDEKMRQAEDLPEAAKKARAQLDEVTKATLKEAKKELEHAAKEMEHKAKDDEKDVDHLSHGLSKRARSAEKESKKDNKKDAKFLDAVFLTGASDARPIPLIIIGLACISAMVLVQGVMPSQHRWQIRNRVHMPTEALG